MDLRQLEYFVAVVEEQQFTRAAATCSVSQSGLSAAIRSLEDELGTTLFARTTRRVDPTEAALALLPHARAALEQATAGRDAVVRFSDSITGTLRVGAEQCLGFVDVPPLLERFHRRYPQVDIHFSQAGSQDLLARMRAGDLDVAFVATVGEPEPGRAVELGRRPIVVLVPAGHALSTNPSVEWDQLQSHEFVDFRESWGIRSLNDASCAAHDVVRRVRCTVDDVHTLLEMVHRGLGIALVPQHVADKPQAAGLVAVRLPEDAAPEWIVSAMTSKQADTSAARLLELLPES